MTSLLHTEFSVFFKAVLLIHSVRCMVDIGCIPNSNRCFIVYSQSSERRNRQQASEFCHKEHSGRLAVIESEATQIELNKLFRSVQHIETVYYFWIGVKQKLLYNWTWLDGTPYSNGANLIFMPDPNVKGHAILKKSQSTEHQWHVTTIGFRDLTTSSSRQTLCECKTTDCTTGLGRYFNIKASRWFDGRNKCLTVGGELAVLTAVDFPDDAFQLIVLENVTYFIGLRNVRLTSSDADTEIKYTNWSPTDPVNGSECVAINANFDCQWVTWNCRTKSSFVCEYDIDNVTQVSTTRVTKNNENNESTPAMAAENNTGEMLYLILGGLVLLIIIAIVIITAAVCYIRKKTADRVRESYIGLDSRNSASGGPTGYSAISQQGPTSNIPDVCYSASAGASTVSAYVDEGPQYAEVRKSAPQVTAAGGEEYANLPQTQSPLKDNKQPTAAAAKMNHKSATAAATVATAAHAPVDVVDSGGMEYACIIPSQQRQSSPSGKVVEQNEYELPSEPVEYATLE